MQYHQSGFRAGEPDLHPATQRGWRRASEVAPPSCVDVLIVGCGPAGLTLAAQLAAFPDIETCILEQKPGPLELGQADGVACRTVEMFNAFGFAERVLREAYWVNETSFWRTDADASKGIFRSGRIQDTEDGLSEFPHVILNQARVHQFFLDVMAKSPDRLAPWYSRRLVDLRIDPAQDHPVTAQFERVRDGEAPVMETVRARYAVGCDGARSLVRGALGLQLKGDSANQAWGVMDVLVRTDFPDIRLKSVISSANGGTIVLIPREGGHLVRVYVEMDKLGKDERVGQRNLAVGEVIAAANRVFHPYSLDVREVAWWSVYEIGQRLCDRFDNVAEEQADEIPCVFIAGDACHTHSPKAGQGMNVSMQDAFNLGWKIAAVRRGLAKPDLLRTYTRERQAIARELIDFDREWASLLSAASKPSAAGGGKGVDPTQVQSYFVRHGHYTAGTGTHYTQSLLTGDTAHQALATGFVVGKRFHSAPVVRLGDAKPMQLGHVHAADGRWRLYLFAGQGAAAQSLATIEPVCRFLEGASDSPVVRFTPRGWDIDAVIDVRAVLPVPHREVDLAQLPSLLHPAKGPLALRDYEKVFCSDFRQGQDIYDLRQVDRSQGCMVLVRPDQVVSLVLPLAAHAQLGAFFMAFMVEQN